MAHPEVSPQGVHTWQLGAATYRALPAIGARLMAWDLHLASGPPRSVLHWPQDAPLGDPAKVRGGNPILFPFVGRTYHKGVESHWLAPNGQQLPMPRHGFARAGTFTLDEVHSSGFTARLKPTPNDQQAYPFDYAFRVRYAFEELRFTVTFELTNHGAEPLPWCAGHHFYFTLPWHPHARREDYRILLEARKAAYHGPDGKLVPDDTRDDIEHFADPRLVDRIHWKLRRGRVSFGPRGGEGDTHLILPNERAPAPAATVVTWTESDASPFYCVEPWMGPPNAPEHKTGLHWVDPGTTESWPIEVSLF